MVLLNRVLTASFHCLHSDAWPPGPCWCWRSCPTQDWPSPRDRKPPQPRQSRHPNTLPRHATLLLPRASNWTTVGSLGAQNRPNPSALHIQTQPVPFHPVRPQEDPGASLGGPASRGGICITSALFSGSPLLTYWLFFFSFSFIFSHTCSTWRVPD